MNISGELECDRFETKDIIYREFPLLKVAVDTVRGPRQSWYAKRIGICQVYPETT